MGASPSKPSDNLPKTVIDGYTFSLICKFKTHRYLFVKIISYKNNKSTPFVVYPSNSELGLWRLATRDGERLYKGDTDYIQQTFIHLDLQIFINNHIQLIGYCNVPPNKKFLDILPSFEKNDSDIFDIIDNPSRQIIREPFTILQQTIKCGGFKTKTPRGRTPSEAIKEFTEKLEEEYDKGVPEIVSDYSNTFEDILIANGYIKKILLIKKSSEELQPPSPIYITPLFPSIPNPIDNVVLYYLDVTLKKAPRPDTFETLDTVERIVKKQKHIMPFLLTLERTLINKFGLYEKYIPCGAFICKLFDYSSGWFEPTGAIQCTEEEVETGFCTIDYSYIGDRYDDIFPFKGGTRHKRKRGTRRKQKRLRN